MCLGLPGLQQNRPWQLLVSCRLSPPQWDPRGSFKGNLLTEAETAQLHTAFRPSSLAFRALGNCLRPKRPTFLRNSLSIYIYINHSKERNYIYILIYYNKEPYKGRSFRLQVEVEVTREKKSTDFDFTMVPSMNTFQK